MEWKMAEAKNKFSELINKALLEGPQKVTRRQDCVIAIDEKDYQKLTGKKKGLKDFLMEGPNLEGVDLTRDQSEMRNVKL